MCTTHTHTHTHKHRQTQNEQLVLILYSFNFEVESTTIITISILPTFYMELGYRQEREFSVGIVTTLRAGRPICSGGNRFFYSKTSNQHWDLHRLLFNRHSGVISLKVKWPGREIDHSPSAGAQVKKEWEYLHLSIRLHVVVRN